jgi:FMN phosphatase YigB (HAD superfamily)
VIEAVTFDFWNTIARTRAMTELRVRAISAACEAGGAEVGAEALAAALERVGLHWERSWAAGEHLHPREGAAMLIRELGIEEATEDLVAEAFLEAGREAELELAPELPDVLAQLGSRGVRLGIVCDVGFAGGEQLRGLLEREGLLGHFSGWGFSDEVGHYKPAPEIFEAALAALAAEPARAAHVGDLRRTDVAGAAALGMRTVRYRGLHDDRDAESGPEAELVADSHRQLLELFG